MRKTLALFLLVPALSLSAQARPARGGGQGGSDSTTGIPSSALGGFRFRSIGPATYSGRIGDIAVHPNKRTWYVAVASGGVWKTENAGTTWSPIFDSQTDVYSIGTVVLDPKNPNVVWVGTGENNAQRSVSYGNGIYKSEDGGRSWQHKGLRESEHIAKIVFDPRDSKVMYVAAQGPLWSEGGERGLYKSTDGGETWSKILSGEKWAGVTDVDLDPRNPDHLLAATWQRHRHVFGYLAGGPESGLHRSTDGGLTWKQLSTVPSGEGRIGLARSASQPNIVYAIAEAAQSRGGTFRSEDGGASWSRRGSHSTIGLYYQEIWVDPVNPDRVYSVDVRTQVSNDGGRTFSALGEDGKHVDNHAVWVDPDDTQHILIGSDGGLYESFDAGATYRFFENLPLAQMYKIDISREAPFYIVCGGTQDNYSFCGPARSNSDNGLVNADWFVTNGGDGFQSRVDPTDPNTIYAESQNGGLVRFDRRTGESVRIVPEEAPGEDPSRWNWDSPITISPHRNTRIYFASQRLWKSEDRGGAWTAVSPDLTRNIPRTSLKMQGRLWSVDAVNRNTSTSYNGNITALTESPRAEGLLYVGTDDGLIQVSENGGGEWRRIERFPGVPDTSYVAYLTASAHDANVVYAGLNNYKRGDFKPYVLRSRDRGRTWQNISANLPERGSIHVVKEDPVRAGLLFAGTEFGLFVSFDDGANWQQLRGGLPPIPVRDIAIHPELNDLVVATFGRGNYVLDDYAPMRALNPAALRAELTLFPTRPAVMFLGDSPLGGNDESFQGAAHYFVRNPPVGATFTYHLRSTYRSARQQRQQREQGLNRSGADVPFPGWDALKAEQDEEAPSVEIEITDASGAVVSRFDGGNSAGTNRVTWNLRWPSMAPVGGQGGGFGGFGGGGGGGGNANAARGGNGPYVVPGTYRVQIFKRVAGTRTALTQPTPFEVQLLPNATITVAQRAEAVAYQRDAQALQRQVLGTNALMAETSSKLDALQTAVDRITATTTLDADVRAAQAKLREIRQRLSGDNTPGRYSEPTMTSLLGRMNRAASFGGTLAPPTGTQREQLAIVAREHPGIKAALDAFIAEDLARLEREAERQGAPWTPGRK
ncbi:MAG: hypothetical protein KF709_08325 [Gemmatimonadaceae bacterium]|nr:hypothetical protein [Gemmatimonadaceae bacterium]